MCASLLTWFSRDVDSPLNTSLSFTLSPLSSLASASSIYLTHMSHVSPATAFEEHLPPCTSLPTGLFCLWTCPSLDWPLHCWTKFIFTNKPCYSDYKTSWTAYRKAQTPWYTQSFSVYCVNLSTYHALVHPAASLSISPFPEYSTWF